MVVFKQCDKRIAHALDFAAFAAYIVHMKNNFPFAPIFFALIAALASCEEPNPETYVKKDEGLLEIYVTAPQPSVYDSFFITFNGGNFLFLYEERGIIYPGDRAMVGGTIEVNSLTQGRTKRILAQKLEPQKIHGIEIVSFVYQAYRNGQLLDGTIPGPNNIFRNVTRVNFKVDIKKDKTYKVMLEWVPDSMYPSPIRPGFYDYYPRLKHIP